MAQHQESRGQPHVEKDIPTEMVITGKTSEDSSLLLPMVIKEKKTVTWVDVVGKNNDN